VTGRLAAPFRIAIAAAWLAAAPLAALAIAAVLGHDGGVSAQIARARLPDYLFQSLLTSGLTAIGVTVVGAALGWLVAVYRFPGRDVFDWALLLPLAAPAYVLAYAYADMTAAAGPLQSALRSATGWSVGGYAFPEVRGVSGAAFVFSLALYPYVYLLARRAFGLQAVPLAEAARTLGRGAFGVFRDVALPLARPAIAAGATLAIMETLADYGTVSHLGVSTLTVGVLRAWSVAGEPVAAARLALILLVVCTAFIAVERASRGRARTAPATRSERPPQPTRLTGARAWGATAACAVVLIFALGAPLTRLVILALQHGASGDLPAAALRSVLLAAGAGVIAVAIALGVALAARYGARAARSAIAIGRLGYATPGAVAALGALMLFGWMQNGLDAVWGGVGPIALAGGLPALFLAYQTRFAAAALGPTTSALERIAPSLDGAARTLGADARALALRVHIPLIRGALISAGLLVFVEVLKELPATMILRPFDFDTLAVLAHGYAADERLGRAAAPALALVAVAIGPMVIAARALARSHRAPIGVGQ